MEYFKAVVDYSKYDDGDLPGEARKAHDNILANAVTFPALPITLAAFLADIEDYETKLAASLKGGSDRTTLKNDARAKLEDDMSQIGTYVNLVAKGDKATIDLAGFDSYSTARVQSKAGVTFIPHDVRWVSGNVSGAETLRWKGDGSGSLYGVQTCTGDPSVEANWHDRGIFSGGKAALDGFVPGTLVWGRVRKLGTGGAVGGWSDPAETRAH